jgi:hypothetical protein
MDLLEHARSTSSNITALENMPSARSEYNNRLALQPRPTIDSSTFEELRHLANDHHARMTQPTRIKAVTER